MATDMPPSQIPAPPRPETPGASISPAQYPSQDTTIYPPARQRYSSPYHLHSSLAGGGSVGIPGGPPYDERSSRVPGMHIAGSSATYTILGLLLLLGALFALIMPETLTDIFFRGHRSYYDVIFQELWRILAATFLAAATAAYALKIAADRHMLNDPLVQRLQLGFFWFALLAVILHFVHIIWVKSLTFWGLVLGALVMAPTLLLPSVHLSMTGGFGLSTAASSFGSALSNVFAPRRVSFTSVLYLLLTVLFVIVGAGYIIIPRRTLDWVFGYYADKRAVFLWQWIGSGMLFLFPALTYTCLERGIEGLLWASVPKTLNVGLFIASLFHILEFGAILVTEGVLKRWLLPVVFVHWCLTMLASILGLMHVGEMGVGGMGSVFEYEPLARSGIGESA